MFITMKAPDKDDGCHSDRKAFVAYAWMPANMPGSLLSLSSDDKMERSMALGVLQMMVNVAMVDVLVR